MISIYCINLDSRPDRWQEALSSYAQAGVPMERIIRVPATIDSQFGALGCTKSHVRAVCDFLTCQDTQYALILEDDFDFLRSWQELMQTIDQMTTERIDWDVVLLTGTATLAIPTALPDVRRALESQSAAGYLIRRNYAPEILSCYAETIPHMEFFRHVEPKTWTTSRLAIDMVWKTLQRKDRWFIPTPAFGHQRPSFSDIEKQFADYSDITFGVS